MKMEEIPTYNFNRADGEKHSFKKNLNKIVRTGLAGLIIFGFSFLVNKAIQQTKEIKYCKTLISQCISKASGEDRVLDFAEGVEMAKGLGYAGAIYPGQLIELKGCRVQHAHLWINRERDDTPISISRLESYLNSQSVLTKEEKEILNSKYANNIIQKDQNVKSENAGLGIMIDPLTGKPSMGINMGAGVYDPYSGKIKIGPTIGF